MKRRNFIKKKAGIRAIVAATATTVNAPNVIAAKKTIIR